jgi:methylmalonyl-CoA/ethylmalonyl-CoA epimerase
MMVKKIDHIGIVVKDVEKSLRRYEELLGLKLKETEELEVAGDMYRVAFLPIEEVNLELVYTTAKTGMAAEFMRNHGEGIHHIAFEVEDLEKTFNELRAKGTKFVWDKIVAGSRGSRIAYVEPEEFNGVYIELIQKKR